MDTRPRRRLGKKKRGARRQRLDYPSLFGAYANLQEESRGSDAIRKGLPVSFKEATNNGIVGECLVVQTVVHAGIVTLCVLSYAGGY